MPRPVGRLPDTVAACVGGGSNAIGLFTAFLDDPDVAILGLEPAGDGVETGRHAATISAGAAGVLHGARTFVLQDEDGQTVESHSISAGLDYPGVGPQHAHLAATGRATYVPVTDAEAMDAMALLSRTEGIIPAIESAHALAGAIDVAKRLADEKGPEAILLVNLSGRGDKDMGTAIEWFGLDPSRPPRSRSDEPHRRHRVRARRAGRTAPPWSATCRRASPTSRAGSRRCAPWSTPAAT